ncbi:MAG: hypothetical protein V3V33_14670 [Candidatus Lokiarchaeia archaeon]
MEFYTYMMALNLRKLLKPLLVYYNDWKTNQREYNHLKRLLKSAKREQLLDKKIVINTVRCVKSQIDREFFMGKLLAMNGAKVYMLLDDGVLKHTESYQVDNLPNIRKIYRFKFNPYPHFYINSRHYMQTFINKINLKKALTTYIDKNLKIIYYSKILKENKVNIENWQELKDYAKSSTIRFFKTSELDYNDKYIKFYYNLSLKNSILSKNIGEYVLNKIKPNYFITAHGIYSTWAPAYHFVRKNGMETIVYSSVHGHSLNPREIYTSSNSRTYFLSSSKFWKQFKDKPVTEEMKAKIEDYFRKRQQYATSDTKVLYQGKMSSLIVNKNDGFKYHLALFPNVIWDGNICDRHKIFRDYKDWILSTINFVKEKKDIKLYIKSHPSEITVLKNSPRIVDIIKNNINLEDVDNVELIPPEKLINTYEFLKSGIDLGLVYDGFLAVEMPFIKIPTIMCVKGGMFAVEGGNITFTKKSEYFDYLDNIDQLLEKFHRNYQEYYDNIVRYAYWYIFEIAIKLPTLSKINYIGTDLLQLRKEDLTIDKKLLNLFED